MLKTYVLPLIYALILSACATTELVPVAVVCPPPPPVPEVLKKPVSTPPSLVNRYEGLTKEFSDSLSKAVKP